MNKMVSRIAILVLAGGASATALLAKENWHSLSDAQIAKALTDRTLIYETAQQRFYASGRTWYDSGQESWGYWRVEAGQYCSQWPPADGWECYGVERSQDGRDIRFVSPNGTSSAGRYGE